MGNSREGIYCSCFFVGLYFLFGVVYCYVCVLYFTFCVVLVTFLSDCLSAYNSMLKQDIYCSDPR